MCHVMETSNIQLKMIIFIQFFSESHLIGLFGKCTINLSFKKGIDCTFFHDFR